MTRHALDAFLHELSHERLVRPSGSIADATELQVHDSLVCVQWNGEEQRLELTLPMIEPLDEMDHDALRLRLYRALLAWQWAEPTGADHLGFGLIEDPDQIVGMASIRADGLDSARALIACVERVHDELTEVWIGLCALVLAQSADAAQRDGHGAATGHGQPLRP